ncbi:MAG: oligosaccharide flippase family protein [Actinomycetia bacterium]|nr:oligosaccharide flippase family protein [Actinomycetes bacterium]
MLASARAALAGQMVLRVGSFALGVFLARVLGPEPFGVYVVSSAVILFALAVNDLGTVPALISSRRPLDETGPTALAMVLAVSAGLAAVVVLVAGPLTEAVGLDGRSGPLRALAVVLVIDALATPANAMLRRDLRHGELARAEVTGIVFQIATALVLVAADAGVWVLVISHIMGNLVTGAAVIRATGYLPRPAIDPRIRSELWSFGSRQAASQAAQEGITNLDYVVIGSRLGPVSTGLYQRGFSTASWAVSVAGEVVGRVGVAAFAPVVDDRRRLDDGFRRTVVVLATVLAPCAALLCGLAEPLVLLLYGEEWLAAVVVVRVLSMLGAMRVLLAVGADVLAAAHRTSSGLRVNLVWLLALVPALLVAIELDGLRGAALAQAGVAVGVAAPVMLWTLRSLGVSVAPVVAELAPIIAAALTVVPTAWVIAERMDTLPALVVGGVVGGVQYLILVAALARSQVRLVIGAVTRRASS